MVSQQVKPSFSYLTKVGKSSFYVNTILASIKLKKLSQESSIEAYSNCKQSKISLTGQLRIQFAYTESSVAFDKLTIANKIAPIKN